MAAALRVVKLEPAALATPDFCACCAATAATSRCERLGAREIVVPYCVRCLRHASAAGTRNLAAAVGSCLLAVTLALALPLAWPSASLWVHVLSVVTVSCLPLVPRAFRPRVEPGHTAAERAAWWRSERELCCTNPRFAEALSTQPGAEVLEPARGAEPRFFVWLAAGPLVAAVGAPSGWMFHHPVVRVLNLTDARMTVSIDDRSVASLEPSSTENPTAGVELRLPSGDHTMTTVVLGGEAVATRVTLRSGATHLFAPQSAGQCFWLEETGYGRHGSRGTVVLPLTGEGGFWVLPRRVDTWFAPNPPAAGPDQRSSGGILVALRQSPCARAPRGTAP